MPLQLRVNGHEVEVADDGASLLEVLRDRLGLRSPKDGCSPQGQCGCCTVLVDGQPRVACVTPARRVDGRAVTTLEGFPAELRARWTEAFADAGASQCGFCTPGIIVRLAALAARRSPAHLSRAEVTSALLAHLCRCTGWLTIIEAAADLGAAEAAAGLGAARPARDLAAAAYRAALEGGTPQQVGASVALGQAGFAEDTAPVDSLVAVPDGAGDWVVAGTLAEARRLAAKVQGRRSTLEVGPPLSLPPGDWLVSLQTSWVEPAYLELDASWCRPGGEPASPLANGGAFGGKVASALPAEARRLADAYGRPVRVVLAREDVVRGGPKRPPVAGGVRPDGTGIMRVVTTPGIAAAVQAVAPSLEVEEVSVAGPPTSTSLRAAGWAEAAVLLAGVQWRLTDAQPVVVAPDGAVATARVGPGGVISVEVGCGPALDAVVLRSYAIGAAHQALGWVTTEGLAVDADGVPQDLTVRSFGVRRAVDTPPIEVTLLAPGVPLAGRATPTEPVNGSDAVFAAVAAAVWIAAGLPPVWPTQPRRTS